MNFARALTLGLLVMPLAAQSTPVSVQGALITGLDSYKKVVNNSTGFLVNVGWDTSITKSAVPARLSLGLGTMPGKEINGLKTSLTLIQLSGDLLIPTRIEHLRGIFGLSLNKYSAQKSGEESPSSLDVDHHFPFSDIKGVKGGLRLGAEYAFNRQVSGELLFQTTELSGRQRADNLMRKGGLNPAWIQCGVRYTF